MSFPIHYSGTVDLKAGVTLTRIKELYVDNGCVLEDEPEILPLITEDEGSFADGDALISVEGQQLHYTVDICYGSYDFVEAFEGFLDDIANECAAAGWTSYDGEDRDEIIRGPSEQDRKLERVRSAQVKVNHALDELKAALSDL